MPQPTIAPASENQWRRALTLVFAQLQPDQQLRQVDSMLSVARGKPGSLAGLFGAWRGRRMVGATLGQVQAGRVANVCPPGLVPGEAESTADMLLAVLCDWLASERVRLAQSLLAEYAAEQRDVLKRQGFRYLAELLYLVSDLQTPSPDLADRRLRFVQYRPDIAERLAAVVEQTYQGTLDCPAISGVQAIEDVLASYRASGVFRPQWWLIVTDDRRDIGCLLLADHPNKGNVELVYMGLVPEARGYGWGLEIVRHAQRIARLAGRRRLVAAVDAANEPALRVYAQAGFGVWDSRSAFVRVFP